MIIPAPQVPRLGGSHAVSPGDRRAVRVGRRRSRRRRTATRRSVRRRRVRQHRDRRPSGHARRAPARSDDAQRRVAVFRHDRRAARPRASVHRTTDGGAGPAGRDRQPALRPTMYFTGQDPVGRRIRLSRRRPRRRASRQWLTIVGAGAERPSAQQQPGDANPIRSCTSRIAQNTTMARAATVLARTRTDPAQATRMLREAMIARRSRPGAVNTRHDGRERWRSSDGSFRVFGDDVRGVRRHRARAVGGGSVRRDRVRRDAADAGDRRADGARRAAGAGDLAVPQTIAGPARRSG